jgi:diguanylate cyclase (GGDEF)-like protein
VSRRTAFVANLRPYDPLIARRSGAGVLAVFALIDAVGTQVAPLGAVLSVVVGYVVPGLLLLWAGVLLRVPSPRLDDFLIVNPLLATALICFLDIVTRDASPGGQIAFCAPVLYAASQLRVAASVVVLVAAIGAELLTVLTLEPLGRALTDAAYVSIILVIITVLLTVANSRQDRLLRRLRDLATLDPLTGLVTRRVFDEEAQLALDAAGSSGVGLILADVDHFKTVNDTYGHPAGDDALAHIAAILRGLVGGDGVVCRLGGDELAVLLPGCGGDAGLAVAETFVDTVHRTPLRHGGGELPLSVSVGVSYATTGGLILRELYAAADASLYDAKRRGRNRAGQPVEAVEAMAAGTAPASAATAPGPAAELSAPGPRGPEAARR